MDGTNRVYKLLCAVQHAIDAAAAAVPSRDETADWECIHAVSSARTGAGLAAKRGLDEELAAAACALHDFARVLDGRQDGHAERGYEAVKLFLRDGEGARGLFTDDEIEQIALAVRSHSKKAEVGSPLEEVVKDADVLDMHAFGRPLPRDEQRARLKRLL
ncbi:MAG: HD domain-containing protein [Clostridiales Family XIII bacterium]|jgi:uncharacterized protein|nr:HD domain-containing protein [Clostridiales Family XIII bacterium]